MIDINGGELLVLGAVAVLVLGPERLPAYAAQFAKLVREARAFARNAREQVRTEMGEDFDDIDWQALDPRRYDPRRIVRDALLDDDEPRISDRAPTVPPVMRAPDDGAAVTSKAALNTPHPATPPSTRPPAPTYDVDAT